MIVVRDESVCCFLRQCLGGRKNADLQIAAGGCPAIPVETDVLPLAIWRKVLGWSFVLTAATQTEARHKSTEHQQTSHTLLLYCNWRISSTFEASIPSPHQETLLFPQAKLIRRKNARRRQAANGCVQLREPGTAGTARPPLASPSCHDR